MVATLSFTSAQDGPPLPAAENRTFDGSGNNLLNPQLGTPGSLLQRLNYSGVAGVTGNNAYADGISAPARTDPGHLSPRLISNLLGAQTASIPNARSLNEMWVIFGALFTADTGQPITDPTQAFPIPVPTGDPVFDPLAHGGAVLSFFRTLGVNVPQREDLNVVNTWFDMSPTVLVRTGWTGGLG
jgi:hypothetical protein